MRKSNPKEKTKKCSGAGSGFSASKVAQELFDFKKIKSDFSICLFFNKNNDFLGRKKLNSESIIEEKYWVEKIFGKKPKGAVNAVVAESRISGNLKIKDADRQIAEKAAKAGRDAGVDVSDYVAVSKTGTRSLAEEFRGKTAGGAGYIAEGRQATLFDLLFESNRDFVIDGSSDKQSPVVDIRDSKFRFIDLFAGIGGIRIGFERAGGKCVFTSEWDKSCQKSYEMNFGEKPHGDITKINAKDIPDHDILTGGFPCQAFSIIGKKRGFADTRGTLFFDVERILKEKHPKAFLLENVKQLKTHNSGVTFKVILEKLKNLDYFIHYKVLNGLDFGVPQKRERIMIVGFEKNYPFEFPLYGKKEQMLADILEPEANVEKKHFLSDYFKNKLKIKLAEQGKSPNIRPAIWHENKGGNIGIHPFSCALRANGSYNYLTVNGERRLTPREMLRLQGFPDSFKIVVPDSQARKQAGNSVVVPQIEAVAHAIIQAMDRIPSPVVYEMDLLGNKKIKKIYEH